jgi:hypothetical protein
MERKVLQVSGTSSCIICTKHEVLLVLESVRPWYILFRLHDFDSRTVHGPTISVGKVVLNLSVAPVLRSLEYVTIQLHSPRLAAAFSVRANG